MGRPRGAPGPSTAAVGPPGLPASPVTTSAAARATFVAFAGAGFAFATWASRIPQVKRHLGLDPSALGLLLLAVAAGSLLTLPLAGAMVTRVGSRRVVTAMAVLMALALATVSVGYLVGLVPVVVGLFLLGFANGAWDVAMNVQGALVEQGLGRSVMSRFHAAFSLGTVAGALLGAAVVALHVPVAAHLAAVGLLVGVAVPLAVRRFLPDQAGSSPAASSAPPGAGAAREQGALTAWRERRTLLVGVLVLAFTFAEGTGNDWISIAVLEGHHVRPALGTLALATFLATMTLGRWAGPALLDRHGRPVVVRVMALVAIAGLALFILAPTTALAFAGAALWGAGASLGFPVGMSAAADEPARAPARVSVVATIGYCAFLCGPTLVGFVADYTGVRHALGVTGLLLAGALVVAGATRPPPITTEGPLVRPAR